MDATQEGQWSDRLQNPGNAALIFPESRNHDDQPQGAPPPLHVQDVRLQGGQAADVCVRGEAAEAPVQSQAEAQGGAQARCHSVDLLKI